MHSEQERWERICTAVKERGARIRRRRQMSMVTAIVGLFLVLAVSLPLRFFYHGREATSLSLADAEIEVALLEHDIMLDEMGIY